MVFIVSRKLRKAIEAAAAGELPTDNDAIWKRLILEPHDYDAAAIDDAVTRSLMAKIEFAHGGEEYDRRYPDGIPTSIEMTLADGRTIDSGLVMYPSGHARNTTADLEGILANKFEVLGRLAMDDPKPLIERLHGLPTLDATGLRSIQHFEIADRGRFE